MYLRWIARFTLGELVGFGLVAALGGVTVAALTDGLAVGLRAAVLYAVAIVGGLGEGLVLGWFQAPVIAELFPELDRRRWILHTGYAASGAWALGMLAPTLDDLFELPIGLAIAITVSSTVLILLSIGAVQARLLAPHVDRSSRWLWANVLGWLGGLPWTFMLPMLLPDDAPPVAFVISFGIGGILMGATTGAVTGRWLVGFRDECAEA